jgi:iron(III) transport system substrate-binding protein
LVIAGEIPLAMTIYIDLPEKDKRAGKPVDWFVMDPVVAQGFNVAIAQKAPHPHAALLFYDYMLSPETQKLLASLHYYPASTKVVNPYANMKLEVIDPVSTMDNFAKWTKSFDEVVIKNSSSK